MFQIYMDYISDVTLSQLISFFGKEVCIVQLFDLCAHSKVLSCKNC